MSELFSGSIELLNNAMSGLSWRQRVLANNIANAETPGFKRSEVRFEELLRQRAGQTAAAEAASTGSTADSPGNPPSFIPEIRTVTTSSSRPDGNNVDLEVEMSRLLQNEMSYNAAAQALGKKLAELRLVIMEGR